MIYFESTPDLIFTLPFVFCVFGFIKKAFKKIKNVAGLGLSFVPGGSIIRQGINVARQGLGAIVKQIKGRPPQQRLAKPVFPQAQSSGFGGLISGGKIFGVNPMLIFGGLAIVGFILFNRKR